MKPRVQASSAIPSPARLAATALRRHDFVDSYSLPLPPSAPDLDRLIVEVLTDLPGWVGGMLRLRNLLVGVFGLRTGGLEGLPRHSELPLRSGGRIGFFPVIGRETGDTHDELLLGLDDKHLDFCVSGLCARDAGGAQRFAVTTVVEFHNLLGRLYFVPVKPSHRLIMRTMMRRLADALESGAPVDVMIDRDRRAGLEASGRSSRADA